MVNNINEMDLMNEIIAIDSEIKELESKQSELMSKLKSLIKNNTKGVRESRVSSKDLEDMFADDSFWQD